MPDDVGTATAAPVTATESTPAATQATPAATEATPVPSTQHVDDIPAFMTGNREFASDDQLHPPADDGLPKFQESTPAPQGDDIGDDEAWYPGWDLSTFEDAAGGQPTQEYPQQDTRGYYDDRPPQQHQQQQQQQKFTVPEEKIEAFIRDPEKFIQDAVQQRLDSMIGPYAYHINEVNKQATNYLNAARRASVTDAYQNVERGYEEIFTKDEVFRSDENFRQVVDSAMKDAMGKAVKAAMNGNPDALYQFRDPRYYRAFLSGIKGYLGIRMPSSGGSQQPVRQPQAVVAGQQTQSPASADESFQLSPDLEEVARLMGPAYRKRLIEGEKERRKRGDLQFHRRA